MNKLSIAKRAQILSALCGGSSMRSISCVVGVSINTVTKLLEDAGKTCLALHDQHVQGVKANRIQCDENWSFCYAKAKDVETAKAAVDGAGDVWTWTAIEADTKLIVSYLVGDRSSQSAALLMGEVQERLANRVRLTTDGHKAYLEAVEDAFGADLDYAQMFKLYGDVPEASKGRYNPVECTGIQNVKFTGDPHMRDVSTHYIERQNLNIRIGTRRFNLVTNAASKKLDNHIYALALYFMHYNFCCIHKTLQTSPAMAAGVSKTMWSMEDIVNAMDARAPQPGKRGPYKKRAENSN